MTIRPTLYGQGVIANPNPINVLWWSMIGGVRTYATIYMHVHRQEWIHSAYYTCMYICMTVLICIPATCSTHLVISLDDVSAVCLVLGAPGAGVVQALYITGRYPGSADSALCDGITCAWDRVDFSDCAEMFDEWVGLGVVGGAMYARVGEVDTGQAAGDMKGSIFDVCLWISLWWQL